MEVTAVRGDISPLRSLRLGERERIVQGILASTRGIYGMEVCQGSHDAGRRRYVEARCVSDQMLLAWARATGVPGYEP
jgi:hypothetical protein